MPDVIGSEILRLRPDQLLTFEFEATSTSAAGANDGTLPYGRSVSSVEVKAYDKDGSDVTSEIVNSSNVSNNIVNAKLQYPATSGGGMYQLRFKLTLDNGEVLPLRFNRLEAVEDDS